MRFFVSTEFFVPRLLRFLAVLARIPGFIDLFRDLKGRVFPAQFLSRQGHFLFAQRRAVRFFFTRFVWRAEANHRATDNQRRFVRHALRFENRFFYRFRVVAVDFMYHVPVVGFEAFCRIVGEPAVSFPVDRDAIVIVKTDQFA
ncbi:hypothetical protein D3C71_1533650 [compost metagenome]